MKPVLFFLFVATHTILHAQDWEEDFNGITTLPSGWSQSTSASDGGWLISSTTNLSSSNFNIPAADSSVIATNDDNCNCDKASDLLMLPQMNGDTLDNTVFAFDLFYTAGSYGGTDESFKLEITFTNGSDWDVVAELGSTDGWETIVIDLTPYLDSTFRFGFRYGDGGGWLYGAALDNIRLVNTASEVVDASLQQGSAGIAVSAIPAVIDGYTHNLTGDEFLPVVHVKNESFISINSFDISYTYNGNTVTENATEQDISAGEVIRYVFEQAAITQEGMHELTFSIFNVNGGGEGNTGNNTDTTSVEGITATAGKTVVIEELTSTSCGFCPKGIVMRDYLRNKYGDHVISLAVHHDDPMEVTEYDAALALHVSIPPSGLVDRTELNGMYELDPLDYEKLLLQRLSVDPGVEITTSVELYSSTTANVVSTLHFNQNLQGSYRIAVVLFENDVTGSGDSWEQVNFYDGGEFGPMGGFELLGDTIAASEMEYHDVARALYGGWNGFQGSVPSDPEAGLVHSYPVGITLDPTWNIDNLFAATLLISPDGQILNAGVSEAIATTLTERPLHHIRPELFPNPADDITWLRLDGFNNEEVIVTISDAAGKLLTEKKYFSTSDTLIPIQAAMLAEGIYSITIRSPRAMTSRSLVIAHR